MRWTFVLLWLGACASGGRDGSDAPVRPMDASTADAPRGPDAPGADASEPDVPPECAGDAERPCTSACGSMGTERCAAGRWAGCTAPEEACNGADDDCDGAADERIAPRACSSSCGGGTESCVGGSWTGCTASTPMAELCNGADDDCDARIDEGLSRACSTACGSGTETCVLGTYSGCTARTPVAETCNNADDDCDGTADDGITRPCSTACGSGTERCAAGIFLGCTAPPVPAEACNRLDDDCDGAVDDGWQVTPFDGVAQSELSAAQPACVSASSGLDVCLTAAHRWCGGRGCYDTGVGLLQSAAGPARVMCVGPRVASVVTTTYAEVSAVASSPITTANVTTRLALSASHRFCRSRGFEAGFGPVEHASPVFIVSCVSAPAAAYRGVPTSDLRARGCDPTVNPDALACAAAADGWCRAAGFEGGFGPVEWNPTESGVVCMREP